MYSYGNNQRQWSFCDSWNEILGREKSQLYICVCVNAQLCPTLCDLMDGSPPGSSVHIIFQARLLEWVAISYSRGSSWPRDRIWVAYISCTDIENLYYCATLGSFNLCYIELSYSSVFNKHMSKFHVCHYTTSIIPWHFFHHYDLTVFQPHINAKFFDPNIFSTSHPSWSPLFLLM